MFVFSSNTGKYGPGKTPYLDTFQAVFLPPNTQSYERVRNVSFLESFAPVLL